MNRNPVNCYWQHQTDHHLQNPITCASSKTHPCHANSSKVLLELHGSTKPTTTCRIRSPHASHETHLCHTISSKLLLELHASTKQTTICRIQSPPSSNLDTPLSDHFKQITSSRSLQANPKPRAAGAWPQPQQPLRPTKYDQKYPCSSLIRRFLSAPHMLLSGIATRCGPTSALITSIRT